MRPLAEAQGEVLDSVPDLPLIEVTVREAVGLVLAEAVSAPHDVPPFANSAMDGYAVRAADLAEVPTELPVLEDVPAGSVPRVAVEPGTAIKIMTGAPMPDGADAVVKVEDTEPGVGRVRILAKVEPGTAVREAGGDIAAGTTVLDAGTRITPAIAGVLASLGITPKVRRRPVVALFSTGDEVVPPETKTLAPGKIRDTNRPILRGLLDELGATVIDYGIVGDDADALRRILGHAAKEGDVVITSGGVSMGEYDLVKNMLADLGTVDFWRVAMQPAKPFAYGTVGGVPFFGLPGNPVSVVVAFEQFVRPALLKMMGARLLFRPRNTGTMGEAVNTDPAKVVFLRVSISTADSDGWVAHLSGGQSSNVLTALAMADAFAVVPVGTGPLAAGDTVVLEMFRSPERLTREEAIGG